MPRASAILPKRFAPLQEYSQPKQLPILFLHQRLVQPTLERARIKIPGLNLRQKDGTRPRFSPYILLVCHEGGEEGRAV